MYSVFEHFLMGEHVYTQTMMPVCEKHGLTYAELTVLMFLANNPTLDTASDIVKCRNISKSHVSISVHSLEERGLITKEFRDGNRRSCHLCLTDLSSSIVNDGRGAQEQFKEMLFSGVSENEKRTMTEILQKIDRNIELCIKEGGTKHAK